MWLVYLSVIAGVAELVDAPDSKSGGFATVRVRVSLPAPVRLRARFLPVDRHDDNENIIKLHLNNHY